MRKGFSDEELKKVFLKAIKIESHILQKHPVNGSNNQLVNEIS